MTRRPWLSLAVAPLLVVVPMLLAGWSAPAGASTNWSTWLNQAVDAVQDQQLLGQNVQVTDLSAVDRTELALPNGSTVALAQRTALFGDGTVDVLVGMTVLGDQQEIVDVIDPVTGGDISVVLAPGSGDVSSNIVMPRVQHRHHGGSGSGGVTPAVAGGCYASPNAPFVVGSIYGPLVKGIGVVSCPYGNESLAVIASLAERSGSGSYGVGNTGSANVWGTYLAVDAYYGCSPSSGHQFHTAQLWSVNGAVQAGATSGWATLGCR